MSQESFEEKSPYDKNRVVLLCVIGALIVLVLSVVLISNSCAGGSVGDTPQNSDPEQTLTGTASASDGSTEPEETDESEAAGNMQTTESPLSVEQTVSDNRDGIDDGTQPAKPDSSATRPAEPDGGTTSATESSTEATVPATTPSGPALISYAAWLELDPMQQSEYFKQFADPEDYIVWLEKAKKEYEEDHEEVLATGEVDLGKQP